MEPNRIQLRISRIDPRRNRAVVVIGIVVAAVLSGSFEARAQEAEVTVPVLLRRAPESGASIVARLPAGTKALLLGRSDDGAWLRLKVKGVEGWSPKSFFKLDRESAPLEAGSPQSSPVEARPLAKTGQ
jgi:hypothetical protein